MCIRAPARKVPFLAVNGLRHHDLVGRIAVVLGRREGDSRRNSRDISYSVFQYLMMPSPSVDPLSATALAIRSIASTPPATHHNSVSLSATLPLTQSIDRSWLRGGSLPAASIAAALVAEDVDLLPVRGLLDQAGDLARGHRRDGRRRGRPSSCVARVLNIRASMPVETLQTTIASAPAFLGAQHVRRHVGLGGIDVGLIDHVGAVLLECGDRGADGGRRHSPWCRRSPRPFSPSGY